jgi:hypothetical protein
VAESRELRRDIDRQTLANPELNAFGRDPAGAV